LKGHLKASSKAWRVESTDRRCLLGRTFASMLALAILSALALVAPMANAAAPIDSYAYFTTFGEGGSQETGPTANGIAVEGSTGRIFVPVLGEDGPRLLVFSPDQIAGGILLADQEGWLKNVASDPSNGSIYAVGPFGEVVKLISDGAPTPTYSQDPAFVPPSADGGVAVDPVTHDVLVGFTLGSPATVRRLDPSTGAVISSFDGSDTKAGAFTATGSLAVGPAGTIYVVDNQRARVERMTASGESLGALPLAEGAEPSNVAVNGQSGEVVVLEALGGGSHGMEGFTSTGQHAFSIRLPASLSGKPFGVAIDPNTGRIYVADEAGFVLVFVPAVQPGVDPPVISAITGESVHAGAAVATGEVPTEAWLEYCPTSAPCSDFSVSEPGNPDNPWVRGPEHTGLEGSGEEHVADDLSGLEPNTAYLFRAHAENAKTENTSATTSATTALIPPSAQTGAAAEVTSTAALLAGTIGTFGGQTTFHFEYGLSDTYGTSVPAGAEAIAGNERAPRTFTRRITGLQPGATYHYRLVAKNSAGVTFGDDRTFTTPTGAVGDQRAYELVTPAEKHGEAVWPFSAQAADDGSALVYAAASASTEANSAPQVSRYLSRRGAGGWGPASPLDPPLSMSGAIISNVTLAVSDDFSHAMVVSNRALAPGAKEQAGNIYIEDLRTGAYTLVGTSDADGALAEMAGVGHPPMFLAGAPDFSWVVFNSPVPLIQGADEPAVYRWSDGAGLILESRLPDGSVPSAAIQPSGGLDNRASEDGHAMYFALNSFSGDVGVYRRENGVTVPISVSHRADGDPTVAQLGRIDGASSDGRYAFFHSLQLTEDAPPAFSNLYRYDAATDELTFVATLPTSVYAGGPGVVGASRDGSTVYFNNSEEHMTVWHDGEIHVLGPFGLFEGWASHNGKYFAYPSGGNLYLYDLAADHSTCISCLPDGSGGGNPSFARGAAISNRVSLRVTDDGQAFFDSTARLVAADRNGARDVYSFKAGILTLISPGDQSFDASYVDASVDGSDVFFATGQALVRQDQDQSLDIYDASIGGGFPEPSPPQPPCQGDACKGPLPATSPAPTPGTSTVTANGNAKHQGRICPKGKHRSSVGKRKRCVKQKRKPHRHKAHKHTPNTKRGGGR
jgi:DNA-binding beta-propeller fold protein YncE